MGLWVENTQLNQWHSWSRDFGVRGSHYPGKARRNVACTVHVIDSWPGADERSTFSMIKHDVTDDGDSSEAMWCWKMWRWQMEPQGLQRAVKSVCSLHTNWKLAWFQTSAARIDWQKVGQSELRTHPIVIKVSFTFHLPDLLVHCTYIFVQNLSLNISIIKLFFLSTCKIVANNNYWSSCEMTYRNMDLIHPNWLVQN